MALRVLRPFEAWPLCLSDLSYQGNRMNHSTTRAVRASAAIMLGWCVGCDGPRTNQFAAQPVSRSVESGSVGLGSVESDSEFGRGAARCPVATASRTPGSAASPLRSGVASPEQLSV